MFLCPGKEPLEHRTQKHDSRDDLNSDDDGDKDEEQGFERCQAQRKERSAVPEATTSKINELASVDFMTTSCLQLVFSLAEREEQSAYQRERRAQYLNIPIHFRQLWKQRQEIVAR